NAARVSKMIVSLLLRIRPPDSINGHGSQEGRVDSRSVSRLEFEPAEFPLAGFVDEEEFYFALASLELCKVGGHADLFAAFMVEVGAEAREADEPASGSQVGEVSDEIIARLVFLESGGGVVVDRVVVGVLYSREELHGGFVYVFGRGSGAQKATRRQERQKDHKSDSNHQNSVGVETSAVTLAAVFSHGNRVSTYTRSCRHHEYDTCSLSHSPAECAVNSTVLNPSTSMRLDRFSLNKAMWRS